MTLDQLKSFFIGAGAHPIAQGKGELSFSEFSPRKDRKTNNYKPTFFPVGANGNNSAWSNANYVIAKIPSDYPATTNDAILSEWASFRLELPRQRIVLFDGASAEWLVYDKSRNLKGKITEILSHKGAFGSKPLPIQVIFFGAPGTGKSHAIDDNPIIKALPKENIVRTMFYPESDYASFVGCYKPVMKKPNSAGKTKPVGKPVDTCELRDEHQDETDSVANMGKYLPLYLFGHNDCLNLEDDVRTRREEITYEFTPQAFTKAYVQAWKEYFAAPVGNKPNDVYLIIEEINRGNCAQIFGNLFQLLDRDDKNFSKYAIDAEHDLRKHLEEELKNESGDKLIDVFSSNSDFNSWATNNDKESIVKGETLCLPPNLYFVASMNTSDQGLFPMDSAFKRRWQWHYIPIKNEGKGHKIVLDKIEDVSTDIKSGIGATLPLEYDWWSFLKEVNSRIEDANSSSDKKLGYWFVKPAVNGSKEIDIETFTCKVISYLWNDVFKNVPEGDLNIFTFEYHGSETDPRARMHPFDTFFDSETGLIDIQMVKDFLDQDKMKILQVGVPAGSQNDSDAGSDSGSEQQDNGGSEQELPADVSHAEETVEETSDQQ